MLGFVGGLAPLSIQAPRPRDELRYVTVTFYGFDERAHTGELLCRFATVNDVHFGEVECGILDGFEGLLLPNGIRPLTGQDVRGILTLGSRRQHVTGDPRTFQLFACGSASVPNPGGT